VLALGIGIDDSSARAWISLIEMYRIGEGVPKDIEFADHLLQEFRFRAGNMHWSTEDSRLLASMWERGDFLPKNLLAASAQHYLSGDMKAARRVLEQAADEGDPFALEKLAWSYQGQGWVVTEVNPKKAEEYLAKAKALRQQANTKTGNEVPTKPKQALKAWGGSAGPPSEGNDESLGEAKHFELSQCSDPTRALYHRLWAEYLTPKG